MVFSEKNKAWERKNLKIKEESSGPGAHQTKSMISTSPQGRRNNRKATGP